MFCDNLKHAMDELNVRQSELVALTGIPKSAMSRYCSGGIEPSKERRERIALALGLDADYFETDSPAPIVKARGDNIHRIGISELSKMVGICEHKLSEIIQNRELPGVYACKGNGDKYIYIINEAVFCRT